MAHAVDDVQMGTLNSDKIRACYQPEFASFDVCAPERVTGYVAELRRLADDLRGLHQGLFLGKAKLQPFQDNRLLVRAAGCWLLAAAALARAVLGAPCCARCVAPPPHTTPRAGNTRTRDKHTHNTHTTAINRHRSTTG